MSSDRVVLSIDKSPYQFLAGSLGLTTQALGHELGFPYGRANRLSAALTKSELLLLDYYCKDHLSKSVPDLLELSKLAYSHFQVADILGISRPCAGILMREFAKRNEVYMREPYLFIYRRDIGRLFYSTPISKHISKNPLWLYRRDNRIPMVKVRKLLKLTVREVIEIEVGIVPASPEILKIMRAKLGSDFVARYKRWWKRDKVLTIRE